MLMGQNAPCAGVSSGPSLCTSGACVAPRAAHCAAGGCLREPERLQRRRDRRDGAHTERDAHTDTRPKCDTESNADPDTHTGR